MVGYILGLGDRYVRDFPLPLCIPVIAFERGLLNRIGIAMERREGGCRHPSNLMLDRVTGKIVHIDFGDCFEVAMTREKFPERIPFRLTRMLVNAMEVSGVEGNFRITCERVMRVLRMNHDSLLAVLEAFVHDPLINWRLLDGM